MGEIYYVQVVHKYDGCTNINAEAESRHRCLWFTSRIYVIPQSTHVLGNEKSRDSGDTTGQIGHFLKHAATLEPFDVTRADFIDPD